MAGATPKLRAFVSVGLRLSGRDANGGAEAAVCCWPGRMNISASDLWRLCFGERRRRRRRGRGGGEGREDREEEVVEGEIASLRLRVRPLPSHARLHQTSPLEFSRNNFTNIVFFFFPSTGKPCSFALFSCIFCLGREHKPSFSFEEVGRWVEKARHLPSGERLFMV